MKQNRQYWRELIILPCIIFVIVIIGYIISIYGNPIEYILFRDIKIKSINRQYFLTDRYKYNHVIGNYIINTDFGDIYVKTGDKIRDHKGGLGALLNVKNHNIKILDNKINQIDSIKLFNDDNFSIEIKQEIDIFGRLFNIDRITYQNNLLFLSIYNFPEELMLNDGTIIKLVLEEGKLYSTILKINDNKINLNIENFKVNNHYFLVQENNDIYKCINIDIEEKWEKIKK